MRIINARVFPVDKPVIENGYVDIEAGRIRAVGAMPPPGEAEDILDAGGGWLFPGFVDAHTHIGMWEDGRALKGMTAMRTPIPPPRSCGRWMRSICRTAASRRPPPPG